ncbi:MAG: hypothetical protein DWQ18_07590 [Crenarchaeota archaeon]|nr:MAG: hypothetical protein DWQ17_02195 [Thermoproteota archaeon]RDJ33029.1 MAG: hypothetical protein DWQ18_07590 [Thermoproteota archaeon]RDJ35769.1 MAG: hypothetical protein DWQ13_09335 [Thermoproteota archaeon]RDJ36467.1 MAG: hypothetical protein DWQ19_07730 [Thermoproteota archaeon]
MDEKTPKKLSTKDIMAKGSIIGVLVTAPSLAAFAISWLILDDLIKSAIIGGVIHFVALGFSFKISKKFFTTKPDSTTENK